MKELFRRLHYLLNRRRLDEELAADLEVHREMAAREGGAPLGNALHLREEARDAWGWTWVDRFGQDLRYAFRMLRKSPGFTVMAVLTLAIGSGINIAAFGFFDFMVLRPLNVHDPATIFRFHRRSPKTYSFVLPYPEVKFFADYGKTLSAVLALRGLNLPVEGEAAPAKGHFVTANWLSELGAEARLGRLFDPDRDGSPGAPPVVVLSEGFWTRHFGRDTSVLGRTLALNGKPATIVGVVSSQFSGLSLEQPDLWAPIAQVPYFSAGNQLLTDFTDNSGGVVMWGRLRAGTSPNAVQEELKSLALELRRQHPQDIWEQESLPAEPGGYAQSLLIGGRRGTGAEERDNIYPAVFLIGTLTLLILAVSCANLGGLLLARGVARSREISIRIAVGAGRARLVRQFLTESMLLALLGSAAGMVVGYFMLRGLMLATGSPSWLDPTPDWRILAFAFGIASAAALLFGLAPSLQISRYRQGVTAMRQLLVASQVAASCVLLIVASLLVRALDHASAAQPGFDYRHAISVSPELSQHGFTTTQARTYFDTLQERLRGLPGVESVALTNTPPFGNLTRTMGIDIDGLSIEALSGNVSPEYFHTMKIPLLRGRAFRTGESSVVIVSQSMARRFWPHADPLLQQLPIGVDGAGLPLKLQVVGVCGDARVAKLEDPDVAQLYFPLSVDDSAGLTAVIRTAGPPEALLATVAALAKGLDSRVQAPVQLLQPALQRKLEPVRYGTLAAAVLGFAALGLACLGIVGVVSFTVSQRVKEIGIRMALGADPLHVMSAILRQFVLPVAVGLLTGVAGAAGLSSILRRVLFGISGLDPVAYLFAVALFVTAALVAAWMPARRALQLDPMSALRND